MAGNIPEWAKNLPVMETKNANMKPHEGFRQGELIYFAPWYTQKLMNWTGLIECSQILFIDFEAKFPLETS